MTIALALAVGALVAIKLFDSVNMRAAQAGVPAHALVMAQGLVLYGAFSHVRARDRYVAMVACRAVGRGGRAVPVRRALQLRAQPSDMGGQH
jgi:hypothetical protein